VTAVAVIKIKSDKKIRTATIFAVQINEINITATMVAVYLQRVIKEMRPWSHIIVL